MIIQTNPAGTSAPSSVTEYLTPDNSGGDYQEVTAGTYNIAAGAYHVKVRNSGISGDITVNGDTVTPGQYWEARAWENRNTSRLDLCPAVEIVVPSGGRATYQTITPST